jgi:transporter family protein
MWILYAFGSAFFAGITAILAKIGIKNTDSNLATAIRTIVILAFSWLMVFVVGSIDTINELSQKTIIFLILSGLATGLSWLCYFRALQLGNVNKVTPIDKSSTILTMVLAIIFLGEKITILKIVSIILIGIGTYLMIEKKDDKKQAKNNKWLLYALGSAVFASLTSILGKIGIEGVESNLGTAIRTIVVLLMAWVVVFVTKKQSEIKNIDKNSWKFLILSGLTTGLSWLCYYKALQTGEASVVVPIDKLSITITIALSYFILKEKLNKKSMIGLIGIVIGTMLLLI